MARCLVALLILFFTASSAFALTTTTVAWKVRSADGALATSGTVVASLSTIGAATETGSGLPVPTRTTATIAGDGSVSMALEPNELVLPAGSHYTFQFNVLTPKETVWLEQRTVPASTVAVTLTQCAFWSTPEVIVPLIGVLDEDLNVSRCSALNFSGSGVAVTYDSVKGTCKVAVTGSGTPGGVDTDIQANVSSAFGVIPGFKGNSTTGHVKTKLLNGTRLAKEYATGGHAGTSGDPFVGWEAALTVAGQVRFTGLDTGAVAYYDVPDAGIALPSNIIITGDGNAVLTWGTLRASINPMFTIAAGVSHVTFDGLRWEPGVSVPAAGLADTPQTGGASFIQLGTQDNATPASYVSLINNKFGIMRYCAGGASGCSADPGGVDLLVAGASANLTIVNNTFDASASGLQWTAGTAATAYVNTDTLISGNTFTYNQTHSSMGYLVQLGTFTAVTVEAEFRRTRIENNSGYNMNGAIAAHTRYNDFVMANNTFQSENFDFCFDGVRATGHTEPSTGLVISGNSCVADFTPHNGVDCPTGICNPAIKVDTITGFSITGNTVYGAPNFTLLQATQSNSGLINGNFIEPDQTTPGGANNCLLIFNSSGITASSNVCLNSDATSFKIDTNGLAQSGNVISGNTAIDTNATAAMALAYSETGATCDGCTIKDNSLHALSAPASGMVVMATGANSGNIGYIGSTLTYLPFFTGVLSGTVSGGPYTANSGTAFTSDTLTGDDVIYAGDGLNSEGLSNSPSAPSRGYNGHVRFPDWLNTNVHCTSSGFPYTCCTGNGTGTCTAREQSYSDGDGFLPLIRGTCSTSSHVPGAACLPNSTTCDGSCTGSPYGACKIDGDCAAGVCTYGKNKGVCADSPFNPCLNAGHCPGVCTLSNVMAGVCVSAGLIEALPPATSGDVDAKSSLRADLTWQNPWQIYSVQASGASFHAYEFEDKLTGFYGTPGGRSAGNTFKMWRSDANSGCTASTVPYSCCTGVAVGTCTRLLEDVTWDGRFGFGYSSQPNIAQIGHVLGFLQTDNDSPVAAPHYVGILSFMRHQSTNASLTSPKLLGVVGMAGIDEATRFSGTVGVGVVGTTFTGTNITTGGHLSMVGVMGNTVGSSSVNAITEPTSLVATGNGTFPLMRGNYSMIADFAAREKYLTATSPTAFPLISAGVTPYLGTSYYAPIPHWPSAGAAGADSTAGYGETWGIYGAANSSAIVHKPLLTSFIRIPYPRRTTATGVIASQAWFEPWPNTSTIRDSGTSSFGTGTGTISTSTGALCTASGLPWSCCTGSGTGTCKLTATGSGTNFNPEIEVGTLLTFTNGATRRVARLATSGESCTAAATPLACCTGSGTGTCDDTTLVVTPEFDATFSAQAFTYLTRRTMGGVYFDDGTNYLKGLQQAVADSGSGRYAALEYPTGAFTASGPAAGDGGPISANRDFTGTVKFTNSPQQKVGASAGNIGRALAAIKQDTTQTGNTAITETDLFSYSVPAATLNVNGESVSFEYAGTFANSVNTKQVKVKFGATTLFDSGALAITGAGNWIVTGRCIRTGAATQKCYASMTSTGSPLGAYAGYSTAAETLSGAVTLKITGTAVGASDIVGETSVVDWREGA